MSGPPIVCPSCGVEFVRHGAARSSNFYRTREENGTCIVCREGLDPATLEPRARQEGTMTITIARVGPPADRDGTILAPGSIPAVTVPICEDFDPAYTPIGRARVNPDGSAALELNAGVVLDVGRLEVDTTIGVGFRVLEEHRDGDVRVVDRLELLAVVVNRDLITRGDDGP